ncbi:tRNA (adenosine(37)-N6)-threonylcarbamoyltransferase complex dimerization subunit type 1 TsaB [Bacillus clarus]|uniref:tRNA (Adenosine(37)-N6)-threonylcarbamoyltransferase complex dimerization subunit type 1 TsaB n=1 Tax=Bacillus clarus TaxID=2338372 RepID=A0A090YYL2_9BACI|nr:tRNA (adenosine(37)-N6)-threonylcarbamoyltransferase complex dimerization subunit type 1 TsaB [Bacillus clarus]KFN03188.1 tRNA threonylcarbamoyl adenosine modification protein YeaZ [Bacillus clarus]RFT62400.1 tRNA (adenosine(37)-N6)-threonylcarbamoyltransferase complex dimerization subunit type 1 TsaB [Bacillus clarus]
MKVLAIDTSNYVMGVSLIEEDTVVGEIITNLTKNHSVRLMPAVEQLLKECNVKPKELNKIVVAAGPGSYTGVRIGVTAAKTLAWSLQIPIVGVSSLEVLAANGVNFNGIICPLFDGRRGQIYTGLYTYEEDQLTSIEEDRIVLIVDWLQMLKDKGQPVLFIGNDVKLHKETIVEYLGEQAVCASFTKNNPRPSELAFLGLQKEEQSVHTFVPSYLRLAEAETKWLESQKK